MKSELGMIGQVFGRLLVVGLAEEKKGFIRCKCDCGKEVVVQAASVKRGATQSCGCLRRERVNQALRTHGRSNTKEWNAWRDAKSRCSNPRHQHFKQYGARGIRMCEEWANSFSRFLADMGEAADGRSLERIDGNEGYHPSNCRWAKHGQQMLNRRTTRTKFDLEGEGWSLEINGPVSVRVVLSQTGECRCGRATYPDEVTCGRKQCEAENSEPQRNQGNNVSQ